MIPISSFPQSLPTTGNMYLVLPARPPPTFQGSGRCAVWCRFLEGQGFVHWIFRDSRHTDTFSRRGILDAGTVATAAR